MAGELIPQQPSGLGSTLTGAANLAQLFLPQNTNQTGGQNTIDNRSSTSTQSGGTTTTTTGTNTDPKAVQAVVDSILQGTNGLAAVSSGQRTAGLYGSSTNQMLTNDLIARTAAEGAKLNQQTTQTVVRPDQVTTTQNAGGQTSTSNQNTTKQAPIGAGAIKGVGGVIGALQLLPSDVKNAVISGLGFGKKAAATGASSLASNMGESSASSTADYGANTAANEASLGGVGTAGQGGQTVAGVNTGFVDQYLGSSAGAGVDLSGGDGAQDVGYSLSGSDASADATDFSGVGDSITQGLGDTADSLGGFLSGVGDTFGTAASDFGSGISDFFSDFDFSFADGGAVSISGIKGKMNEHVAKKLADGGGIGAAGDTRYGNTSGGGRAMQSSGGSENIFQRTNRTREETAGTSAAGQDVMQRGFIPRTEQERQSVFSLIDTVPQLLNALLGNDSNSATGKADGGSVSRPFEKPAGYANGGSVTQAEGSDVYDLSGVSYLANTGLHARGPDLVRALGASTNDQVVNHMIQDNIRPTEQSNNSSQRAIENTARTAGASGGSSRSITEVPTGEQTPAGNIGVSEGSGIGSVAGIGNAIGISPGAANAGLSGMNSIAGITGHGIPGLSGVIGLATAQDNNAAVNAAISAAIGIANPVAGLIASIALGMINPSPAPASTGGDSTGNAADDGDAGDTSGISASVDVGPMSVDDAAGLSANDAAANAAANNANGNANSGPADSGNSSGGGSSGDNGSGAAGGSADGSYADGSPGGISVAQTRADPATTADKIPAMLSEEEYVLPADVTAAIGIPALDALVAKYHMPAEQQQRNHRR